MEIREARGSDVEAIESVANASLHASYDFLDEETIDAVTAEWYDDKRVRELIDGEHEILHVANEGSDIRGFVQATVVSGDPIVGEVHWLHVHPDARGQGLSVQLLGSAIETLEQRGAVAVRGLVLSDNEEGTGFYEAHDFERREERSVEVGDDEYAEAVYEKGLTEGDDELVETIEGPDGELFVAYAHGERGLNAPFYPTYRTKNLEDRYGWFCSNCNTAETTMDSAGRIQCSNCENKRKATRWDASYL